MDDATALRLKKIELSLQAAERTAALESNFRIAVIAVLLTFAASAGLAAVVGQLPMVPAGLAQLAASIVLATQVRALRTVGKTIEAAAGEAMASIDTLIGGGGEQLRDVQADAGRAPR
ncbi:MAG TPA: hypothetical protein VM681_03875 [Candidatus Thermoplasmatota archaeon]|nr:hypothetical protein [Candidatus Thermoplasmatota archaeon]